MENKESAFATPRLQHKWRLQGCCIFGISIITDCFRLPTLLGFDAFWLVYDRDREVQEKRNWLGGLQSYFIFLYFDCKTQSSNRQRFAAIIFRSASSFGFVLLNCFSFSSLLEVIFLPIKMTKKKTICRRKLLVGGWGTGGFS